MPAPFYLGWVPATVFGFTASFLLFRSPLVADRNIASAGPFSTGFPTECNPIKPYTKEKPTMSYGGPWWSKDDTRYRIHNPTEPVYVGPPYPDIYEVWDILLKIRYSYVTEKETEIMFDNPHIVYNHTNELGYLAGLDVLHILHCDNQLREALDKDYYFNKKCMFGNKARRWTLEKNRYSSLHAACDHIGYFHCRLRISTNQVPIVNLRPINAVKSPVCLFQAALFWVYSAFCSPSLSPCSMFAQRRYASLDRAHNIQISYLHCSKLSYLYVRAMQKFLGYLFGQYSRLGRFHLGYVSMLWKWWRCSCNEYT